MDMDTIFVSSLGWVRDIVPKRDFLSLFSSTVIAREPAVYVA